VREFGTITEHISSVIVKGRREKACIRPINLTAIEFNMMDCEWGIISRANNIGT
jgi:hypothetical protein